METLRCKTGTLKHVETGTSDGRAAFTVRWVEILVTVCERIWGSNITANTRGGFNPLVPQNFFSEFRDANLEACRYMY